LAYKKKSAVNWCPSCKTVLSDEQVEAGKCERCKTDVVKKEMSQWFFKITDYAERLLKNLDKIDWSEKTKLAQKNWIGKSEGIEIDYDIDKKYNFVLLHGFGADSSSNFLPWLKKELEEKGHKVQIFDMPDTDDPNEKDQVKCVLENAKFDENTILFGHSLGTVVAMKVLEKLDKKIAGLVMAGAFIAPKFKDNPRPFEDKFDWEFDFEKIKSNTVFVKIISDKNDYAVPIEQGRILHEKLGGDLMEVIAEEPHFLDDKAMDILNNIVPKIKVFTTRPDTNFGATFIVLAPENKLIEQIVIEENKDKVRKYINESLAKDEQDRIVAGKEKTGVFTGSYCTNNLTGQKMPIWVSDFVLGNVGTGAVVAVPGHDIRDFEFASKFDLPIIRVVVGKDGDASEITKTEQVQEEEGKMINSDFLDGLDIHEATEKVMDYLEEKGWGKRVTTYRLRDWCISRQRFWGPPIPMIYCDKCGTVPVPEKDLPVLLPETDDYIPDGTERSPLARDEEFVKTKCPKCNRDAKRETDVSDTFLDSAWYFFRYLSKDDKKEIFDKEVIKKWLPVDIYIGGHEHAVLHLLYTRFITMFFHDMGLIDFEEPFKKFRAHGLIIKDGAKMSKSKGNVLNPDDYIEKYGADVLRTYLMFIGPFKQGGDFRDEGVVGITRFFDRVYDVVTFAIEDRQNLNDISGQSNFIHKTIKIVTEDFENLDFNTAISKLMIQFNGQDGKPDWRGKLNNGFSSRDFDFEALEKFLILLSSFAPHLCEELWNDLGNSESIFKASWPEYDESKIKEDRINLIIQVNGKVRASAEVDINISEDEAKEVAMEQENVVRFVKDKEIKKVIFVKGKLLNIVV